MLCKPWHSSLGERNHTFLWWSCWCSHLFADYQLMEMFWTLQTIQMNYRQNKYNLFYYQFVFKLQANIFFKIQLYFGKRYNGIKASRKLLNPSPYLAIGASVLAFLTASVLGVSRIYLEFHWEIQITLLLLWHKIKLLGCCILLLIS